MAREDDPSKSALWQTHSFTDSRRATNTRRGRSSSACSGGSISSTSESSAGGGALAAATALATVARGNGSAPAQSPAGTGTLAELVLASPTSGRLAPSPTCPSASPGCSTASRYKYNKRRTFDDSINPYGGFKTLLSTNLGCWRPGCMATIRRRCGLFLLPRRRWRSRLAPPRVLNSRLRLICSCLILLPCGTSSSARGCPWRDWDLGGRRPVFSTDGLPRCRTDIKLDPYKEGR